MSVIRTLIVDDEPLAIEGLEIRLAALGDIEVVGSCPNGRKAIAAIRKLKPDLVLLDIQMPGLSGFDVVKTLVGSNLPLVVFVTAYDEYALKAFEAHALDYLLKPVDEGKLRRALARVRKVLHEQTAIEQNARLVKLIEGMQDPPAALLSAMLAETAGPKPGF
ncbi:MAG TPA: response regulator, partial [Sphingomonadales bacterium]|nr:response regulator [Sphingomonadales bacterium]